MELEIFAKIILVFISAIGFLLIWWVLRSDSDKNLKNWFMIMTVLVLLWSNFSFLASRTTNQEVSVLLYRLNWSAVSLFLYAFYKFYVIYFLKKSGRAKHLGFVIMAIAVSFLVTSLFTDLIIAEVVSREWGMEVVFGKYSNLFNGFSVMVASAIVFYSLQGYGELDLERKSRLRYFLGGILIFVLANLVFNVGSQILTKSVKYQFLGDFSSIFLLGFTAYATIQHKLFDVKVIASEALTAILLTVLFSKLFVSQSNQEFVVDLLTFGIAFIFGVMLVRSVDREIKQREKLQELTEKLRAIDKQKDEFISMAAHELRAPMTAIKGYISLILDGDAGAITDKAKDYLTDVTSVNDRLIRLVNNMLNVSRIEEGRLVYKTEIVGLIEIANNVYKSFKFEAERKGLTFTVVSEPNLNDTVEVDADRLTEVVGNFVSNAVKYTDHGSITINITQSSPQFVRLAVKDTGPGVSKSEQEKLFQKFFRVESTAGKTIGTGLGLYISKLLVEKFGGQIGIISEADKGSEFWFTLPVSHKKLGEVVENTEDITETKEASQTKVA